MHVKVPYVPLRPSWFFMAYDCWRSNSSEQSSTSWWTTLKLTEISNIFKIILDSFLTLNSLLFFYLLQRFYELLIGIISIWSPFTFILRKNFNIELKIKRNHYYTDDSLGDLLFNQSSHTVMDGGPRPVCGVNDDTILNL